LASLHVAKSSGAGPSARGRAELGGGIGSSAEWDSSFSWARVEPRHLSARPTHSLSRANQCEEAPHCTAGRIVRVHDSLMASLLERKQVEKICVHNIPEGGA